LLNHQAGLVLFDLELPLEKIKDFDFMDDFLARQTPLWDPGTNHGYHLSTLGFYLNQLIQKTDPKNGLSGNFFMKRFHNPWL